MKYSECYENCGGEDCVCCEIYWDHQSLGEPGYERYEEYEEDEQC